MPVNTYREACPECRVRRNGIDEPLDWQHIDGNGEVHSHRKPEGATMRCRCGGTWEVEIAYVCWCGWGAPVGYAAGLDGSGPLLAQAAGERGGERG